jgi:carbohydrate-selective porin OprB
VDRHRPAWILPLATAYVCLLVASTGSAQQPTPPQQPVVIPQTTPDNIIQCSHAANPRRRQRGCNDQLFGWDEALAGDWNDVRRALREIGITPTASYVGTLQTNVTGGGHEVWSYAGQLSFGFSADFQEFTRIRGLSAYVGISWGTGSNLAASLDSLIPTSGLYAPSFYLGEMYLQETLAKNKLKILAGRLAASNSFASIPVFANYINYGINPNPFSIGANDITFFSPPTGTEWGAQATYTANRSIQFAAGAFNTNINSANGEDHGADFTIQEGNKGVLAIGEFDYLRNQGSNAAGKPGELAVGFLHNNNTFPTLTNPLSHSDGYSGAYVMGQQMIYRPDGRGTLRGATVWGSWTYNSKTLVNPVPWFWGAGLSYRGLFSARKNDIVSAGLVSAEASKYAPIFNREKLIELNYQWDHSRYLVITPHIQYLFEGESPSTRNATVLGIQLALTL